jgi:hypothetical protein
MTTILTNIKKKYHKKKEVSIMAEKTKLLVIDEEVKKFNDLEIEVDATLKLINTIIDMFSNKTEIAKGSTNKLVLLFEQKISLLTRKESINKNMADMKRNMFTANAKIKSVEDGDNDLAKIMMNYTEAIKKQQKTMLEAKNAALTLIKNEKDVKEFFDKDNNADLGKETNA